MTSRQGAFTSDAVGIIAGQGDRIDALERYRSDPGSPSVVASYVPLRTIPGNGSNVRAGKLSLPAGISKLEVAAFFDSTGGELGASGFVFPAGWEEEHVLAGGLTVIAGGRVSGLALLRSSVASTSPFYVTATTDGGAPVQVTAALFVTPVGSVSID